MIFRLLAAFLMSFQVAHAQHIAVAQIVEHAALDQIRDGLKESLENRGYTDIQWHYENAQGNPALAAQIAKNMNGLELDVVVALSTPMAQALANNNHDRPLVFAAVSDPVEAKLVASLEHPGKNITGMTDTVPTKDQLALMHSILPHMKTIGVIFNPGEANSRQQVVLIKEASKKLGIAVIESPTTKSSETMMAAKKLMGQVDAILLPTDNTVVTALESVIKVANQYKTPVFASDVDAVKRGALAALGLNWKESGAQVANIVDKILKGAHPGSIAVEPPQKITLHVNQTLAKKIGLDLPPAVLKKAERIF